MYIDYYYSPIGTLEIIANKDAVTEINLVTDKKKTNHNLLTDLCKKELEKYFSGKLKKFSVKIELNGTKFQQEVWKELINIPYGETVTYKELAKRIGNINASRAVGNANNKNKIPIIIPCHRVIGTNNKLVGYALGLDNKKRLLELEGINVIE